ncbi:anthranilate synthase component I family protein [Vibrio sp. DNB22_10_4]
MKKNIPVKINREFVEYESPITYFSFLRKQFGDEGVYILESLSGPEEDTKSSLIGFDRIIRIEGFKDYISINCTLPKLLQILKFNLKKYNVEQINVSTLNIKNGDPDISVEILKSVQGSFDYKGNNKGYEFGYFGYFAYEMIDRFEEINIKNKQSSFPNQADMVFDVYATTVQFDLENEVCEIVRAESPYWDTSAIDFSTINRKKIDTLDDMLVSKHCTSICGTMSKDEFFNRGETVMKHIEKGDVYQLQLGHEMLINSSTPPFEVYKRMRERNPAPYMYYAPFGNVQLIGASPEVFVKLEGKQITMRPIAGTVKRSSNKLVNEIINKELLSNEKELAEHLMLVDLCRNDIGRVAQHKTLDVTNLMCIEEYSHVNHIVSTVCAELSERHDNYDLLCETFPAGTMTGTPKVRAMEIIEGLEKTTRGIYSGFVGVVDFNGYSNTALVIRSTVYSNGLYSIRASAGFVADSTLEGEWNESIAKLSMAYWAITGKEMGR